MRKNSYFLSGLTVWTLIGALAMTGCPPKKKLDVKPDVPAVEDPVEEMTEEPVNKDVVVAEDGIRIASEWTEAPSLLRDIPFAYDSASLDDNARAALKENVAALKKLPLSVSIRVEGHCDDRGTIEYNIALGQRRAEGVRSYYATAGIARNRLHTISFGEERPVCTEETDSCRDRNRRASATLKSTEPVTIKPESLQ